MTFPRLGAGDVVVLDLETKDPLLTTHGPSWCYPGAADGYICGVAACWGTEADQSSYWSVRHPDSANLAKNLVQRWVRDVVKSGARIVMHNAMYDRGWLRTWDIGSWPNGWEDTMTLAALDWEYHRSYSLEFLGQKFHVGEKRVDVIKDYAKSQRWKGEPGSHIWRMPSSVVGPYAVEDARVTWGLYAKLRPRAGEEGWDYAYQQELRLQQVLLDMRATGVRVDEDGAQRGLQQLEAQAQLARTAIRKLVRQDIDVWSAESIAAAARLIHVQYPLTPTGKPSFRKAWLEAQPHPLWTHILSLRAAEKAGGTFIQGLLSKTVDGRVHGQFHPLRSNDGGAVTGRFSSSDPNLQNQPAKVKWLKRLIRGLFLPEEGQRWAALDYSQQEPRVAVHFAVRTRCRGAKAAQRLYQTDRRTDFHNMVRDMASISRDRAKILNLAMMYGQGEASTCHALGFPTEMMEINGEQREVAGEEGRAFIALYHEKVPFVKALDYTCRRLAKNRKDAQGHGYIKTLWKRRCRFGEGVAWPYQAMNRLVQGSSADQTKAAMIALHSEGAHLLVTVHDEVGCSVEDLGQARRYAELMETCVELEVPSVVDVEIGDTWGAAELPDEDAV